MRPSLKRINLFWLVALSILLTMDAAAATEARSLAERLGYKATDKLLIVNGDDAGMCHAANMATIECIEKGLMRSSTIMVPCPWFPEIAAYAKQDPDKDFGVHLCHTAEWTKYRWGPVADRAQVPGLVDADGYLWRSVEEVYAHAKPEEALIEARAQIKRALASGIDITHLDSHMGTLQLNPEFFKVYVQLALEFDLPLRMASQDTMARYGQPELRAQVAARGIVFPDYFIYEELKDESKDVRAFWLNIVRNLKPGVTELYIHAALPTDEMKAISGSWSTRAQEYDVFTHNEEMKRLVAEQRIILIGYRPLRDLQRSERKRAGSQADTGPGQRSK
ncbi:MAG TPA: polysaccharide deacetylase family protein [Verrucomicrobiota bacterium]|nr:polysaccharide deacetylase family protein [Verrucomicrobiota bacterium]